MAFIPYAPFRFKLLCHTYYTYYTYFTYGIYTICSFAHTNAYLELLGAIWKYLELSGHGHNHAELIAASIVWSRPMSKVRSAMSNTHNLV